MFMRAPGRRRPQRRRVLPEVPPATLADLARRAEADASVALEPAGDELDPAPGDRLAVAFTQGQVSGPWENGFPRYAWLREGASVLEYRLVRPSTGSYVGYRLPPSYWPEGLA
jgi:hypothetical protein